MFFHVLRRCFPNETLEIVDEVRLVAIAEFGRDRGPIQSPVLACMFNDF